MTTHDRDKVIAAAKESKLAYQSDVMLSLDELEAFYAIAYEDGRQAELEEMAFSSRDAEVAALRKDAERYFWLRERYCWLRNGGDDDHGVGIYDPVIGEFCFTTWNAELDEAIDHARSTK